MDEDKVITKEIVNDCREKYAKARKLIDEESKNDPSSEPYLSKYKAKDILKDMQNTLKQAPSEVAVDAMLGAVLLQIGIIDMDTEELPSSEQVLTEAEALLTKHAAHPRAIVILLNVYNNLGILWCNREDPEKAKTYLLQAKDLYEKFKCTLQMPLSIENQFGMADQSDTSEILCLEKAFTLTLYYLAQVYGSLKMELKSAIYCHITLRRQLEYNDYDAIDWALNSATLSQFFAVQNGFTQSRHHLAAASIILEKYEEELEKVVDRDEHYLAKRETLKHRSADVALCWIKYSLNLMKSSRNRLRDDEDEPTSTVTDLSNLAIEEAGNLCDGDFIQFDHLDLSSKENKITDKYLLTFDDARNVYVACHDWFFQATQYYSLENLASDYIKIIQDQSELLCNLAFFEEDEDRRAKMHKKRINLIEKLLKEINPTYYMQYCRQLWYELGEIHTEILNIKLDKVNKSSDKPTPHALTKINMLCSKSVENYQLFINSLKDPRTQALPAKLDEDLIKPVVNAYVMIGRNTMKNVAPSKSAQLMNVEKAYESYKAAVDYCDRDEKGLAIMKEEISLCREMITILPLQIRKLMMAANQS